ncbi:MAG: PBECR2 nuclease fold domain-containing protein [Methylococcales bacterium]|nr:PBECR2 nuclease fold domain-containing protein [Methylococcales bacterium]
MPADTKPEAAVLDFLAVFGATMEEGAAFTDAAGSTLAITKALFEDGSAKFKWLANPEKADRLQYINLMAMALLEPDEIWWAWEEDRAWSKLNPDKPKKWRLKRRYLRAFSIEGISEFAISAFEWGGDDWLGSTAFMAEPSSEKARLKYFDKQRNGRLIYKK